MLYGYRCQLCQDYVACVTGVCGGSLRGGCWSVIVPATCPDQGQVAGPRTSECVIRLGVARPRPTPVSPDPAELVRELGRGTAPRGPPPPRPSGGPGSARRPRRERKSTPLPTCPRAGSPHAQQAQRKIDPASPVRRPMQRPSCPASLVPAIFFFFRF